MGCNHLEHLEQAPEGFLRSLMRLGLGGIICESEDLGGPPDSAPRRKLDWFRELARFDTGPPHGPADRYKGRYAFLRVTDDLGETEEGQMRKILIGCDHKRLLGEGGKPRATGLATGGGAPHDAVLGLPFYCGKGLVQLRPCGGGLNPQDADIFRMPEWHKYV